MNTANYNYGTCWHYNVLIMVYLISLARKHVALAPITFEYVLCQVGSDILARLPS